jgi:hypothetical protein
MRTLSFLSLAFIAGCSEQSLVTKKNDDTPPKPAIISGRVCSPNGRTWLSDAMAYTNILDETGKIIDVRKAYSDCDGRWTLTDLAPDRQYTVYVQFGQDVLSSEDVYLHAGEEFNLPEPDCFDPTSLNILVVTGDYDNTEALLQNMGFTNFSLLDGLDEDVLADFFRDPANLAQYDVIFLNGGCLERHVFWDTNPANDTPKIIAQNLKDYVYEGGSIFATDWAYDVIEAAWPDAIDFVGDDRTHDAAQVGEYDTVKASVTDEALSAYIADTTTEIDYDLPVWPPINSVEPYVSIHLTGSVHYREGESTYTLASVPLLVSFSGGNGRVAFSTFRIAANQTEDMTYIVQYVFHELAGVGN